MELDAERVGSGNHPEHNGSPVYQPPAGVAAGAAVSSLEQYKQLHAQSLKDPDTFWGDMARKNLTWFRDFKEV